MEEIRPRPGLTAPHPQHPPAPSAGASIRLGLLAMMAIWGANVSVVKLMLPHMDPMVLSLGRMSSAALVLVAVMLWQGRRLSRRALRAIGPHTLAVLAGCGFLMVYLNQVTFTYGVKGTAAANASLIIALNPLVSALGAALLLGDRLTPRRLLGVALGFGGVMAVVLHRPGMALGGPGFGDAMMFGSVLTWVGGGLIVQRLARRLDTGLISTLVTSVGAAVLVLHVALDPGSRLPDPAAVPWWVWPLMLASGASATAAGALVWNRGLQVLGVARTALFVYWVPIFGVGFAVGLLGEPLTVWHGIGLAAVLSGTWLGTRGR